MNDQTENYPTACSHVHVERFQIEKDGRVFEEQWRCRDCGEQFYRLNFDDYRPQIQIMEPVKTLRDEFAMAAMIADAISSAMICCVYLSQGKVPSDRIQNPSAYASEYFETADAMLMARKSEPYSPRAQDIHEDAVCAEEQNNIEDLTAMPVSDPTKFARCHGCGQEIPIGNHQTAQGNAFCDDCIPF